MYPIICGESMASTLEWLVVSMTLVMTLLGLVFVPRG